LVEMIKKRKLVKVLTNKVLDKENAGLNRRLLLLASKMLRVINFFAANRPVIVAFAPLFIFTFFLILLL